MPKRLFNPEDEAPTPGEISLSAAVPPRVAPGACGLCACLQAAFASIGQEVGYSWLMGLTGAGFMLRMEEGFGPTLPVEGRWKHLDQALAALGYPAALLTADSNQWREALPAELAAGRPALALGWGALATDWSLIMGLKNDQWLGYNAEERPIRRQEPSRARLVLCLAESAPRPEPEQVGREALKRAAQCLADSLTQYPIWQDLLTRPEPYGAGPGRSERFHGEQWLVQCLADAREAAAEFLYSGPLPPECSPDRIEQAAQACALVAETAEQLLVAPEFPWQKALDDEAWLEERRALVEELFAAEEAAGQALDAAQAGEELLLEGEDW